MEISSPDEILWAPLLLWWNVPDGIRPRVESGTKANSEEPRGGYVCIYVHQKLGSNGVGRKAKSDDVVKPFHCLRKPQSPHLLRRGQKALRGCTTTQRSFL